MEQAGLCVSLSVSAALLPWVCPKGHLLKSFPLSSVQTLLVIFIEKNPEEDVETLSVSAVSEGCMLSCADTLSLHKNAS